jgi:HK97 family phage major capsid protein
MLKLNRNRLTIGFLAVVLVLAVANLAGHPLIDPQALAGLGLLQFAMSGEVSMEIKQALDKQAEAWGEFMRKNDALLQSKAEGKAVSDLQASVDKINGEFTKLNADLVEIAKKSNRPGMDSKGQTPEQAEYKQAFGKFLRKGDDNGLEDLQRKAYNSASGPDGGYLVLPEMDTEITRVVGITSAIGRLATVKNIGTDTYKKMVKTKGMLARRVGPGASGGETDTPKLSELEFTAHEAEAEPWIFNSTLDDAVFNLEADLADEAAIAFAELAGLEFAVGTGAGSARGITAYDIVANSNYAWGKVGVIKSGAAGDFSATAPGDRLIDLQHALKAQYRPGAAWITSDPLLGKIRQMKDGSGAYYLWQPDPLAGFGGRLLGNPVEIDDNMPNAANNSLSLAFGNFKQAYVVVNRSGIVVIRDNITAKGKTKFNFRRRFGGGVQNFEAYKLMQFSA